MIMRITAVSVLAGLTATAAAGPSGQAAVPAAPVDQAVIAKWRKAAATGNAEAQLHLGDAYRLGTGVPVDLSLAETWYRQAAGRSNGNAEAAYGRLLFQTNRHKDALPWLSRGARRGDPQSQYILGVMAFNGDSVQKNWVRAYALMLRAAAAKLPEAVGALGQMNQMISPLERQEGAALARQYETEDHIASRAAPVSPQAELRKPVASLIVGAESNVATSIGGKEWRVQLGAFRTPGAAQQLWSRLSGKFAGHRPDYVQAGPITRLLVGSYRSSAEAERACGAVQPCLPIRS